MIGTLRLRDLELSLDRPRILGVVNITTDSFSDGGRFFNVGRAIEHGVMLRNDGADIVDVGGESTRPGAEPISVHEEIRRVIPVIEGLVEQGIVVSIDTLKPEVMRAALSAGASMVNDVNAFRAPGAIDMVAGSGAALCVMHMQGSPQTMQVAPRYDDVVAEVGAFLRDRVHALEEAGIAGERIVVDPGFGFGKNREHNVALFRALPALAAMGYPVMVGLSRKRLIGDITGRPVNERVAGSVAAALLAVQGGAAFVRVHDVKETLDALNVWIALRGASESAPAEL